MNETTLTVLRYYVEGGALKVEAVRWKWVAGNPAESEHAAGAAVDPGMAARARPLPSELDPGLVPNLWVWVAANDAAAKLPRPTETIRGEVSKPDGSIQETVEHVHAEGSDYWDFYRLPLRSGVELVEEDAWRALKAVADAAAAEAAKAQRDLIEQQAATQTAHKATARAKLSALGLTDDEISAIVGGR